MTFILTEDQEMLRETGLVFMRDEFPVDHLRGLRDSGKNGVDPETRTKLAELGFFGMIVPEEPGGEHFGLVGLGQILEAQGRTIAATPLLQTACIGASALQLGGSPSQQTACIGASALQLGGSPSQQTQWLPKISSGEVTFALAIDEHGHHEPTNTATKATANDGGYTLNGIKRFVPDGHHADMFIIVARSSGSVGDSDGLTLFLVPKDADGISIAELRTVDSHGSAHIALNDVTISTANVLGAVDKGWDVLDPLLDRARIGISAEMLGLGTAAFEKTLEYMLDRKQFGQPIASFQALQHRMAKMFAELELTRSCVAHALSAVDKGSNDISELASIAKARASELVHLVSNEMIQLHGGIGMTDESDAGFYLKRARVQENLYGTAGFHRDRYARLNGF